MTPRSKNIIKKIELVKALFSTLEDDFNAGLIDDYNTKVRELTVMYVDLMYELYHYDDNLHDDYIKDIEAGVKR